jgi:hypothetical protein
MPLTPPAYPIPREAITTDNMKTKLRTINIFFISRDMFRSSLLILYFLTATGSAPGIITSSSTFLPFFNAVVVAVPMKLKKRIAAGIS